MGIVLFAIYTVVACWFIYFLRTPRQPNWWVKVITQSPACTYYFGPFDSLAEAETEQLGYIEDLREEGLGEIISQVKRCNPKQLTIYQDQEEEEKLVEKLVG